jgi:hypothetical protein
MRCGTTPSTSRTSNPGSWPARTRNQRRILPAGRDHTRYSFARDSTPQGIAGPRGEFDYELYDRQEDPLELRNLAHNGGAAELVEQMNDLVDTLVARELRGR